MRFLADSLLQGRAPGTPGYDIAASYVASQLEGMGLRPGAAGKWFQPVTLQKAVVDSAASSVVLIANGKEQKLVDARDYVLSARFANSPGKDSRVESDVDAPAVFVGFGVTAPAQKYDDYAGVNVRGKLVLAIYGAPAAFPTNERAYYTDGTVKSRIALEHGAVGMLSILLPDEWRILPWDWMVSQVPGGEMHWQEKNGVPHDYFGDLKANATFSPKGAELLFAGAPKTCSTCTNSQTFLMLSSALDLNQKMARPAVKLFGGCGKCALNQSRMSLTRCHSSRERPPESSSA